MNIAQVVCRHQLRAFRHSYYLFPVSTARLNRNLTASSKMATLPTKKLNDGNEIPIIGYGTGTALYKTGGSGLDEKTVQSVVTAIKVGYHHIDGAEGYGNEEEVAEAIKQTGISRDKLFITTKISKPESMDDIPAALDRSLKKLNTDHVDLYLIHTPFYAKDAARLQKDWAVMEQLKASGKAKSIGVSNFKPSALKAILETAKVKPAINQVEFHPYLQRPELVKLCHDNGVQVEAYAPLTPATKPDLGPVNEIYERIAKENGVTTSEVGLRWVIEQGVVPVTTSSKESRLKDMLKVPEISLSKEQVQEISDAGAKHPHRVYFGKEFGEGDFS